MSCAEPVYRCFAFLSSVRLNCSQVLNVQKLEQETRVRLERPHTSQTTASDEQRKQLPQYQRDYTAVIYNGGNGSTSPTLEASVLDP